ncbi:MAG TPA: tetratricopeptide repeat protein [Sedimentisphaerales bacterium]|nr:tetratricopeptide repeat protein [Sedimentisphaerales bacterium]
MIQEALFLLQNSRYDQAERTLRQLLAEDPENPYAHALLGLCLMRQDKLADAEGEAKQAIHLAPDQPYCHFMFGLIKAQGDDLQTARLAAEEAIRLAPEESDYHGLRAGIYLRAERWQEALDSANEGLTHDPTHQGCLNHRATALVKLNRHEEAHRTIDQALMKDPENAQTHANLGWALLHKGLHRGALEHFSQALRLNPNFAYARHGLVEALKAKYFLYRWLLRFFLWMSTLSPRARGGLIVGAYVLVKVLQAVAQENPAVVPFVAPIVGVYVVFVLLTWTIDPMSNLILQCNRYGRYALSRQQRWSSSLFGLLLLGGGAAGVAGLISGRSYFLLLALHCALLIIPTTRIPNREGGLDRMPLIVTLLMALAGVLATASLALGYKEVAILSTVAGLLGLALFTWFGVILGMRRQKV